MPPKNSGGSTKFPGGHKVIHRTAQTAFVRVVTPRTVQSPIGNTQAVHAFGIHFPEKNVSIFNSRENLAKG